MVERRRLSNRVYNRLKLYRRPMGSESSYKPEYCEMLIEAGERGETLMSFAGSISHSYDAVKNWQNKFPEFAAARQIADAKFNAYWEARLRAMAETGKGSPVAAFFMLKNRIPDYWKDVRRQEVSGPEQGPIKLELSADEIRGMSDEMLQHLETALRKLMSGRDIKLATPAQRPMIEGRATRVADYEETLL